MRPKMSKYHNKLLVMQLSIDGINTFFKIFFREFFLLIFNGIIYMNNLINN